MSQSSSPAPACSSAAIAASTAGSASLDARWERIVISASLTFVRTLNTESFIEVVGPVGGVQLDRGNTGTA